ncbi:N-acetylmuramoyl-L-alanine amidase [Thermomonas sp.]|uniref:N-acetylmuramoyl-L-alanine amidase n=1 Tax=Thermomonas sp. TaxID=1971895 RepID=UPI002489AA36|nr:N-acetylmuramoyl-L-alanine amidase [Thermomonas sp.]MDI1253648.1 N-acetylmuramoyl-L-alanine amidase [Thermomonas sp.]
MRVKELNLQQVLLSAALIGALCWNLADASEIKGLRVNAGATGTRAELLLDREGQYKLIDLRNPDRLVLDFPDSRISQNLTMPQAAGVVKGVRSGQPQPGTVRIVFDLASNVSPLKPRIEQSAEGPRLVLEWPGDDVAHTALPVQSATTRPATNQPAKSPLDPIAEIARKAADTPVTAAVVADAAATDKVAASSTLPTATSMPGVVATGIPTRIATGQPVNDAVAPQTIENEPAPIVRRTMQAGMRPLVVAIDAGHGGQDPGAHGKNGSREKDVTLAIARELARQVNATPGLKAYLTRDTDEFIPLPQRARRASANKADIFLSIHADAAENRSARGSSVYVLSTRGASSQRARWLADKENAADVIGGERIRTAGNTLTSVLLDLTQSGNMKASEDAADHVLSGLKRVGNNHKPDIERANFAVLRTSDKMPAMLVETAFISNPDEEKRLTDPGFQRTLAAAILDGVDDYFSRQPPPGTLYAARAQVSQSATAAAGGSP